MLDLTRVRGGEWIAGGASLALLLCTFLLPWYGLTSVFAPTARTLGLKTTVDGWNSLETLRWLIVLTALVGIAVVLAQASRPGPALPVALTVITTVLGMLLLLGLIYRVLISQPGGTMFTEAKAGGYAGLFFALTIVGGCYLSLREDGIAPADAPAKIETLRLQPRSSARA
jgi:hypothetical protein